MIVAVGVVERSNRITNFALVDLAEFGFGFDSGSGSDRIIRLTVAEVGVEVEVDQIDLFPAAAAVGVDQTN